MIPSRKSGLNIVVMLNAPWQVVQCAALAASASILQQLMHSPEAAGRQHPAQDDVQHTRAKSVSRAICILDGPIQVQAPALLSLILSTVAARRRKPVLGDGQRTCAKMFPTAFATFMALSTCTCPTFKLQSVL